MTIAGAIYAKISKPHADWYDPSLSEPLHH